MRAQGDIAVESMQQAKDVLGLQGFTLARFSGVKLAARDRLISMLLQDRGVMRIVSAPHGYGKTLLAYEYARRIFSAGRVAWIDGSSPEFLRALDVGHLVPEESGSDGQPELIVIDDMPILDEQRMETLARCADDYLLHGTEIVVTTLPSCDFLRCTQPDRVLVTAKDLLVTERDLKTACMGQPEEAYMQASEKLACAKERFMGAAACTVWSAGADASLACLRGFFEESVPLEFHRAALAMLIMQSGSAADLARIKASLSQEFCEMAARDYLFLGYDAIAQTFATGFVPAAMIKQAIEEAGMARALLSGSFPVHEKALGLLLEAGDTKRVVEAMRVFCTGAHCAAWLKDCGWELIDSGSNQLAGTLFERCGKQAVGKDATLNAISAWLKGMVGDNREAAYYAREALYLCSMQEDGRADFKAALAAQLALLAFSDIKAADMDMTLIRGGIVGGVASSASFLLAVTSLMSDEELDRWAWAVRGNFAPFPKRQSKDSEQDQERIDAMVALFTKHGRHFEHTFAYRIALHMLACSDHPKARKALHECSTGVLVAMRKRGLGYYSDAVVVGDLWRSGYFGVSTKSVDVKDAKVLSSASSLLMRMCREAGREACSVPWEQATGVCEQALGGKTKSSSPKSGQADLSNAPVATVSLFGGLEVIVGEKYVPQNRWTKRSLQLFSILVMNQGKDVSRDIIFQQMWPELTRSRALDNFYTAWSRMNALVGEGPYFSRRGEFCSINPRYVVSDVAEFEQLSRRILIEQANAETLLDIYARMETVYRGGLLPSENDNVYIKQQRNRYRAMFIDAMLSGAAKSMDANDARVALWFARKAIDEDKEREDVYTMLIKAQMAAGQRCSAIRTYFQCKKYLRDELGLDPSPETQRLYEQLIACDPSLAKLTCAPRERQASV